MTNDEMAPFRLFGIWTFGFPWSLVGHCWVIGHFTNLPTFPNQRPERVSRVAPSVTNRESFSCLTVLRADESATDSPESVETARADHSARALRTEASPATSGTCVSGWPGQATRGPASA